MLISRATWPNLLQWNEILGQACLKDTAVRQGLSLQGLALRTLAGAAIAD